MTPPVQRPAAAPTGLLEKLLGAVRRPEFRVDVYVSAPDDPMLGRPACSVNGCDRSGWEYGLCPAHSNPWRAQGRPELAGFGAVPGPELNGRRTLAPQLKLEFQYAVQCRHDQETITAPPPVVTWALRLAAKTGTISLADHEARYWRELSAGKSGGWYEGFLLHAHEVVQTLRDGTGWDVEYPRDIWRLHTLPGLTRNPGHSPEVRNHLRFDRLTQPWLRALAKRWCRLRLSSGLTVGTVISDVTALTRFSLFLEHHADDVMTLAALDRSVLERYLAWVSTQTFGDGAKDDCITTLGAFFQAIRQHGWGETLPTTAVFVTGDIPRRPPRLSRQLADGRHTPSSET